ncbi:MAG: hypothetical protein SVX43_04180 [Cyanobacteriota bacterium]|nr:hypothetical protein [Cyanobacteriota bacterium]
MKLHSSIEMACFKHRTEIRVSFPGKGNCAAMLLAIAFLGSTAEAIETLTSDRAQVIIKQEKTNYRRRF